MYEDLQAASKRTVFTFASLLQLLLGSVGHAEHASESKRTGQELEKTFTGVRTLPVSTFESWLPKGLKPYFSLEAVKAADAVGCDDRSFRACSSNVMNSIHSKRELSTFGGCKPQGVFRHPAVRIQAVRQGWVQL